MTAAFATLTATTLAATDYRAAVGAGALVVDLRCRVQRERQGVLPGAIAVQARPAVAFLDPRSDVALASVTPGRDVALVSDDGLDAELFAWELHSRGVTGVRAVDGGFEALRDAGALGLLAGAAHIQRERTAIAAH